ncbi:MAG: class I SAM-dependent methyltransferase [Prosthecobacter sp.]|jgi:hypothetical protein
MKHSSPIAYSLRHPAKAAWKLLRVVLGQVAKARSVADSRLPEGLEPLFLLPDERRHNATCENMYIFGGSLQRQRLDNFARWSAARYPGDFVEIGAFKGETSKLLAKAAAETGRRLIVIDPWMTGTMDCDGTEHEQFLANIAPWKEHVDVWRESSLAPGIIARLKERPLCFAFVDGLHTLKACFSDIMAAGHAQGIIATDDVRYNQDLAFVHCHAARLLGREAVIDPDMREAYILPRSASK